MRRSPPRNPPLKPISPVKFYSPTKGRRDDVDRSSRYIPSAILANDIFYDIQQHSGRYKRKHRPDILKSLYERALCNRVTQGDKSYIACKFLPNWHHDWRTIGFGADRPFYGTFEKDGDLFICATYGGKIRVFDTRTDETRLSMMFKTFTGFDKLLECTVSPDARHIAYSLKSGKIVLQPIERRDQPAQSSHLDNQTFLFDHATALRFSPLRDELIAGTRNSLYVFNLYTLKCAAELPINDGRVLTVALADASSQIFYSAGDNGLVMVWDRRALHEHDAKPVGILQGHKGAVNYIDSKGDGRYLISSSNDQTIKLWDIRRLADRSNIQTAGRNVGHEANSSGFRTSSDTAAGGLCEPLSNDVSVMTYRGHTVSETEIRCRFSPAATTGQRFIYSGCHTGCVRIFDVLSGELVSSLVEAVNLGQYCIRDVSWHPHRPVIKACSFDASLKEWVYSSGTCVEANNSFNAWRASRPRAVRSIFAE